MKKQRYNHANKHVKYEPGQILQIYHKCDLWFGVRAAYRCLEKDEFVVFLKDAVTMGETQYVEVMTNDMQVGEVMKRAVCSLNLKKKTKIKDVA